jgi:hypothetical protein
MTIASSRSLFIYIPNIQTHLVLDDGNEGYGEFRVLYVNGQVFLTESVDLLNHSTRQGSLFDV